MPRLLMAVRTTPDGQIDSEPVLVQTTGSRALLTLDDGQTVDLDHDELTAALRDLAPPHADAA
jgi:hypothetical protein